MVYIDYNILIHHWYNDVSVFWLLMKEDWVLYTETLVQELVKDWELLQYHTNETLLKENEMIYKNIINLYILFICVWWYWMYKCSYMNALHLFVRVPVWLLFCLLCVYYSLQGHCFQQGLLYISIIIYSYVTCALYT